MKHFRLWLLVALCAAGFAYRSAHAAEPQLPPTFLSAVALYDADGRFLALEHGSTRFRTCGAALEDTRSALEKVMETAPGGARAIGLCIPLHTFALADLIR